LKSKLRLASVPWHWDSLTPDLVLRHKRSCYQRGNNNTFTIHEITLVFNKQNWSALTQTDYFHHQHFHVHHCFCFPLEQIQLTIDCWYLAIGLSSRTLESGLCFGFLMLIGFLFLVTFYLLQRSCGDNVIRYVCLSVCLLPGYLRKLLADLTQFDSFSKDQSITFWDWDYILNFKRITQKVVDECSWNFLGDVGLPIMNIRLDFRTDLDPNSG